MLLLWLYRVVEFLRGDFLNLISRGRRLGLLFDRGHRGLREVMCMELLDNGDGALSDVFLRARLPFLGGGEARKLGVERQVVIGGEG